MSQIVNGEVAGHVARPDPDRFFQTDHLTTDLRRRTLRGGAITAVSQGFKFILTIGSQAILARILSPADVGLVAMVTFVTGLVGLFRDMGLSMATVQRAEINHRQVSTLFWTNMAICVILAVITAAMAPLLVWFYHHETRLTWITIAFAGGFLLSGISAQHQALLQRQMKFLSLAIVDIVSLSVGVTVGILSAKSGLGYWALVIGPLSQSAAFACGVWIAFPWRPGPPLRHTGLRSMLSFGGKISGYNGINYLARNLDNALIGRVWHEDALGFYKTAYSLLTLPLNQINAPITAVAVPGLSRLQNDPERFRSYYLKALSLITFISLPLVAGLLALTEELVLVVLGEKWGAAIPLFRILGISAMVQPILNPSSWLYIATGQTGRMFKWGLVASPLICLSFVIGVFFSTAAVAWCYSIMILLLTWPCLYFSTVGTSIRVRDIVGAVWQAFVSSLAAGAVGYAIALLLRPHTGMVMRLLIAGGAMTIVYFALMLWVLGNGEFYLSTWRDLRQKNAKAEDEL